MASDLPLARRLLDEVSLVMRQYQQGMGPMIARLEEIQKRLRESHRPLARTTSHLQRERSRCFAELTSSRSLSEIASELYLSNTIKTHTTPLYRKLGARFRRNGENRPPAPADLASRITRVISPNG